MDVSEDSADRILVFKGKRSKRPRQLSPATLTSTSSTGGGSDGGAMDFASSSATTSTTDRISTSTEEDEDMANCLILLAQSKCEKLQPDHKKFTELATTVVASSVKPGVYLYECKTCNRTFPSFQALGGHRTSHKKSKIIAEDTALVPPENHDTHQNHDFIPKIMTPSVSTLTNNKRSKIHECSICGAEFSSGQALGGHMRRHRPPTATPTNTKGSMGSVVVVDEFSNNYTNSESSHDQDEIHEKPRIILSLDLNLPAPPEDDQRENNNNNSNKFDFSPRNQSLVFSAAALVDCHY